MHVVEREGTDEDDFRGLLPFGAGAVDVGHAGRTLAGAIEIDLEHLALGARLEIGFAHEHRQHRGLRACLRVVGAAEPHAEAAEGALPHADAERIGVVGGEICGRRWEWMIADRARGLGEQRRRVGHLHRRQRIVALARPFERIAARLDDAVEIAGFAGDAGRDTRSGRRTAPTRRR